MAPEPARIASARAWASSAIASRSAPVGIDGDGACPSRASTNDSSGTGSTSRGCGGSIVSEDPRPVSTAWAAASTRAGTGSSGRRAAGSFQLDGRFSAATAGSSGGSGGASATGRPMLPLSLPPREMGVGGRCALAA